MDLKALLSPAFSSLPHYNNLVCVYLHVHFQTIYWDNFDIILLLHVDLSFSLTLPVVSPFSIFFFFKSLMFVPNSSVSHSWLYCFLLTLFVVSALWCRSCQKVTNNVSLNISDYQLLAHKKPYNLRHKYFDIPCLLSYLSVSNMTLYVFLRRLVCSLLHDAYIKVQWLF